MKKTKTLSHYNHFMFLCDTNSEERYSYASKYRDIITEEYENHLKVKSERLGLSNKHIHITTPGNLPRLEN